jgi:hypothetical protein
MVVLCSIEGYGHPKFVTWTYNLDSHGFGHGHYFEPPYGEQGDSELLSKALEDFNDRN